MVRYGPGKGYEFMTQIKLPKWYDLHVHLRQGAVMKSYIRAQIDMGCAGLLAMPNSSPPVAKIAKSDPLDCWSIESYQEMIRKNGGDALNEIIAPLYLTKDTSAAMIERGAASGILKACKYYPPHGTTGAGHAAPLETYIQNGVFESMEENGTVLCVHGEEHGLSGEEYFGKETSAEDVFYKTRMPEVIEKFPDLKIVCEHITTKTAARFVQSAGKNIAATITPQHLLYTIGDLVKGFRYHLYCLPLVKFEEDRAALHKAVTDPANHKFFAGTDSAPHTTKATECGCAAGCFTGGIAPQLYAQAFEQAGLDLDKPQAQEIFKKFLCINGAKFYELPVPGKTFTLERKGQPVRELKTDNGTITPLPLGMGQSTIPWSIT